jgi:transketolase
LGSAVSEVLSQNCPTIIKMIGIIDSFGESGKAEELMDKYGLRSKNIVETAIKMKKS